jgi:hypothetical protein
VTNTHKAVVACAFAALTAVVIVPVFAWTALWVYTQRFSALRSWAFVLNGFVSATILGLVIAVPLGLLFFHAPIRWALVCALPAATTLLVLWWLADADGIPRVWWVTYTDTVQFLLIFVVCAYVAGRIRRTAI